MLLPGPDLHRVGPLALWNFRNIFLPNTGEDQKKSYRLSAGPLACSISQIRPWLLHYVHKKVRGVPQLVTFKIKPLNFTWVIRLNWLANINLKELGPLEQYYCWGPI